jgi:hypothetical protein
MFTPVLVQTDGFKGKMETLCPLVICLFMLVGDFFDESLSRTSNGFQSFGAFTKAAEVPPTEYRMDFTSIPHSIFAIPVGCVVDPKLQH